MNPILKNVGHGMELYVDPTDQAWMPFSDKHPFETHVVDRMRPLLQPGVRLLDVGANIGFFTILAAKAGADVIAFEPSPKACELLKRNIEHHSPTLGYIDPFDVGLSNQTGRLKMQLENGSSIGKIAPDGNIKVPVIMWDDDDYDGCEVIDIVKIDVDGHDMEAAQGMKSMLKEQHPIIFAEFCPYLLADPKAYLQFYLDLGYKIEVIGGSGFWTCTDGIQHTTPEPVMAYVNKVQPSYLDIILT
jgi:FkbM family methyltransferase